MIRTVPGKSLLKWTRDLKAKVLSLWEVSGHLRVLSKRQAVYWSPCLLQLSHLGLSAQCLNVLSRILLFAWFSFALLFTSSSPTP